MVLVLALHSFDKRVDDLFFPEEKT